MSRWEAPRMALRAVLQRIIHPVTAQ